MSDVFYFMVGCASIVCGCVEKNFYYASLHGTPSKKSAPRWLGRLLFWLFGGLLVIFSIRDLFFSSR